MYCYTAPNTSALGFIRGEPVPVRRGPEHYHLRSEDVAYLWEWVTDLYEVLFTAFLVRDVDRVQSGKDHLFALYNVNNLGVWWVFDRIATFRQLLVNQMGKDPFLPPWACYLTLPFAGAENCYVVNFYDLTNEELFRQMFGIATYLWNCATSLTGRLPAAIPGMTRRHEISIEEIGLAYPVFNDVKYIAVIDTIYETWNTSGVRVNTGKFRHDNGGVCTNADTCLYNFVVSTGQVECGLPVGPPRGCWNRRPPAEYQTSWQAYVMDDRTYSDPSDTWVVPFDSRVVETRFELFSGSAVYTEMFRSTAVKRNVRAACENETVGGVGWGDGVVVRSGEPYRVETAAIVKDSYWQGDVTTRHAEWYDVFIPIFSHIAWVHPMPSGTKPFHLVVESSCMFFEVKFGDCLNAFTDDYGTTKTYEWPCSNQTLYVGLADVLTDGESPATRNSFAGHKWKIAEDADDLISRVFNFIESTAGADYFPLDLRSSLVGKSEGDMRNRPPYMDMKKAITSADGDHDRLSVFKWSVSVKLINPIMAIFSYYNLPRYA